MADTDQLKELRRESGASLALLKEVLEEAGGNMDRARELLRDRGGEILEKKSSRETREGRIDAYVHSNAKVGALVEVRCETDFVSRNDVFRELVHNIAMQIAATDPEVVPDNDIDKLLKQPYIKNPSITLEEYFRETVAKLKENIQFIRFTRYSLS